MSNHEPSQQESHVTITPNDSITFNRARRKEDDTNEEIAYLEGLRTKNISKDDINTIVRICSQDLVYNTLFKGVLKGEPYDQEKALFWIGDSSKSWEEKSKFVYVVRDASGKIVGAIDIKSANLERAEIGYWADETAKGYISNALKALIGEAVRIGYKKLFACVLPSNARSQRALMNNGFVKANVSEESNGELYEVYEVDLVENN